ncbi:MAG: cell envelope integrity protein CreD [Candidatus Azobacteroides sp.]|nr:cell envelope integrity protein CreD [Candidatus Azobacteroides sp.]
METNEKFNLQEERVQRTENESSNKKSKSAELTTKGAIVAVLILVLLIPTSLISNLIKERLEREKSVREEVCSKWASEQTLAGPFLIIPYNEPVSNPKENEALFQTKYCYILPETLNISGEIIPFERYRSIYKITVYQSDLKFNGAFPKIDAKSLNIPEENLLLDKAVLYFELSDFRGIEEQLNINWNSKPLILGKESTLSGVSDNGLTTPVELKIEDLNKEHQFSLNIKLKGSENLKFIPLGKTTETHLSSSWKNPSFTGNFIPNNPAEISENGFKADWKILHLNLKFPQIWKGTAYDIDESAYGVTLLQSTDSYAKTERSAKYAILFTGLTFALYFFIEILQKKKVHPLQYVLVGLALCIFYTLLLSISEYLDFNWAYLISSVAIIILISLYTASAFKSRKIAGIFCAVLSVLYGFIFILIQLQDGALLFGSIGLFMLLAVIMYYSRKIDWYKN